MHWPCVYGARKSIRQSPRSADTPSSNSSATGLYIVVNVLSYATILWKKPSDQLLMLGGLRTRARLGSSSSLIVSKRYAESYCAQLSLMTPPAVRAAADGAPAAAASHEKCATSEALEPAVLYTVRRPRPAGGAPWLLNTARHTIAQPPFGCTLAAQPTPPPVLKPQCNRPWPPAPLPPR